MGASVAPCQRYPLSGCTCNHDFLDFGGPVCVMGQVQNGSDLPVAGESHVSDFHSPVFSELPNLDAAIDEVARDQTSLALIVSQTSSPRGSFDNESQAVPSVVTTEVVEELGVVTNVCNGLSGVCSRPSSRAAEDAGHRHDPFLVRRPPDLSRAVYSGQWDSDGKERVRQGYGSQVWDDGTVYEGQWLQGEASGKGRIVFADGQIYTGEWHGNLAEGFGISRPTGLTSYSGCFKHGLRHGIGVEAWGQNGGGRYEGEFEFGKRHGYGICVWPDGFRYIGCWRSDRIHGLGTCIGADGHVFHGKWFGGELKEDQAIVWPDPEYKAFKSRYTIRNDSQQNKTL